MTELKQRSTDWRMKRNGEVTCSRYSDIKPPRSKSEGVPLSNGELIGATALAYLDELLTEMLTGKPQDRLAKVPAIEHGNFYEPIHREAAQVLLRERFDRELILPEGELAYVSHPTEPHIGGSPDYAVGDTEGGEMKCPWNACKHMAYIRTGREKFILEHQHQVQGMMWITGWQRFYCSSYHPDFPSELQLILWPVERDDAFIRKLESRVLAFRDLLLEEYARLSGGPF